MCCSGTWGGSLPRSQAKRLRERQGKRKEAVKGAWGRPRRGVATGRRWPVASRRLADACVAAYVGGWSGQQGAALALASRAVWMGGPVPPGGPLAAPRRAARHDRLVKVEGPRFSAWLSASSPSRRRPPLCAAPFRLGCQCKPVRMVREDEHTNTTQPVPCYGNSRRRTVQHATLHTCTVS